VLVGPPAQLLRLSACLPTACLRLQPFNSPNPLLTVFCLIHAVSDIGELFNVTECFSVTSVVSSFRMVKSSYVSDNSGKRTAISKVKQMSGVRPQFVCCTVKVEAFQMGQPAAQRVYQTFNSR
jgi:hypothetical protein